MTKSLETYSKLISLVRDYYGMPEAFIPLHEPRFVGNDRKYVMDAIDSTFVSSVGKYVDRFEEMIRDYTGAKYAIAVSNGTAALHLNTLALNVKPGDKVITTPITFVASANCIRYCGGEVVFADIDPKTFLIDYNKVEKLLSGGLALKIL